jgi:hypothetical protein
VRSTIALAAGGASPPSGSLLTAMGQTRKSALVTAMSAIPPIATELRTSLVVRFVPEADIIKSGNRPRNDAPTTPICFEAGVATPIGTVSGTDDLQMQ